MAESKHAQYRYKYIDSILQEATRNSKGIEIEKLMYKLNEILESEFGQSITRRQLEKDLEFIESYFKLEILRIPSELDKRIKRIRYAQTEASINQKPLSKEDILTIEQLLKELQSFEGRPNSYKIQEISDKLSKEYFKVENTQPIVFYQSSELLKGRDYFSRLYENIHKKSCISIQYKDFYQNEIKLILSPYFLKEYNTRWYIFGYCHSAESNKSIEGKITNLALDRIESISLAYAENYLKPDIEFSEYFDEIYGVTLVDSPVEEIVLHFYEMQGHYIATNPIHPLQKGKWIDEKTYELRLKLRINYELISKLLSYGAQLKVVKPDILVQRMRDTILQMNSLYPLNG